MSKYVIPGIRMSKYVITGTLANGQRFDPIHTNIPNCYNIYRGTVWEKLESGKRKKVYTISN
jgi:hypothetical protein